MVDAVSFLFWAMLVSWIIGGILFLTGFIDDTGFLLAIIVWLLFSLPLTTLWAIIWVIVKVFA